jgi:enoyl-CoA hydratase/carnithine racemase
MPPLAVRKAKELLYRSDSNSLAAMLDLEIEDQTALMRSR